MELGIRGRRAIVCAASKGLGRGCAEALAAAGVDLVLNARGAEALEATAATIRETHGVAVTAVAADITSDAGRAAVLAAMPEPDILVTNAGGPPPGVWSDWSRADFLKAIESNMLTPIFSDAGGASGDDRGAAGAGSSTSPRARSSRRSRRSACRTPPGPGSPASSPAPAGRSRPTG